MVMLGKDESKKKWISKNSSVMEALERKRHKKQTERETGAVTFQPSQVTE